MRDAREIKCSLEFKHWQKRIVYQGARLHAGPAGSPVVPVPKRPRTESSAVARINAALFLLDTAVVSPSFVGPLAGSLQEAQAGCAGDASRGAEIRRAVQARLGLPQPAAQSAPAWHSPGGASPRKRHADPDKHGPRGAAGAAGSPKVMGQDRKDADARGVDVPVGFGALPAQQRLVVGTPPRPRRQPPSGPTQTGPPPGVQGQPGQEATGSDKSGILGANLQSRAGVPQLQTEAAVAKGPAGADLHLPTPLKLPLIPAAAARDRPDSAGLPAES